MLIRSRRLKLEDCDEMTEEKQAEERSQAGFLHRLCARRCWTELPVLNVPLEFQTFCPHV